MQIIEDDIFSLFGTIFIPINFALNHTGIARTMVNKHHGVELFLKSHKKLNPGLQFLGRGFQYFTSSNRIATGVVQMNPGSHKFKYRSVEYSALYSSLHSLSHDTVFFPYRVCCGADGGEWDVVLDIIKSRVHNPVFVRPKRG